MFRKSLKERRGSPGAVYSQEAEKDYWNVIGPMIRVQFHRVAEAKYCFIIEH